MEPLIVTQSAYADNLIQSLECTPTAFQPHLSIIKISNTNTTNNRIQALRGLCMKLGVDYTARELPEWTTTHSIDAILPVYGQVVSQLSQDPSITGIVVLADDMPAHMAKRLHTMIPDRLDVELHTANNQRLRIDNGLPLSIMAVAILRNLDDNNIDITGKHAVLFTPDAMSGQDIMHALLSQNATVSILHPAGNMNVIPHIILDADIFVSMINDKNVLAGMNNTLGILSAGKILIDAVTTGASAIPAEWDQNCTAHFRPESTIAAIDAGILYNTVHTIPAVNRTIATADSEVHHG